MIEIENNVGEINKILRDGLLGGELYLFSYSGIYTLHFDLRHIFYGYNYLKIDIGTEFKVFEKKLNSPEIKFDINSLFNIWSKRVTHVDISTDLVLNIEFDNNYICKIESHLFDPDSIFDMRWSVYQSLEPESFYIVVSDDNTIYLKKPKGM